MRKLLLVRHAQSRLTPGLAPAFWPLTDAGRESCKPLAIQVAAWQPESVFTSAEAKAIETGDIIAGHLQIPVHRRPGLNEHKRPAFDQPLPQAEFFQQVERLFDHPDELVFGEETANEALDRYAAAIEAVMAETSGNVIVVSHGTVMALFMGRLQPGLDVRAFWRNLVMPDLVVVDWGT